MIENAELQKADKQSLVLALTRCAKDGLMPDGREAALVVRSTKVNNQFVKKAVYMPMVDGVIKCACQSGQVSSIFVDVVYEADEFKRWADERGKHFKHIPNDTEERMLQEPLALLPLPKVMQAFPLPIHQTRPIPIESLQHPLSVYQSILEMPI